MPYTCSDRAFLPVAAAGVACGGRTLRAASGSLTRKSALSSGPVTLDTVAGARPVPGAQDRGVQVTIAARATAHASRAHCLTCRCCRSAWARTGRAGGAAWCAGLAPGEGRASLWIECGPAGSASPRRPVSGASPRCRESGPPPPGTAITLPVGVEDYAAYALRAWLAREHTISARTRRFAASAS